MPAETSPAFQFYVKDWRSSRSVQRMSFTERGIYLEMLMEQWENLTIPDDPAALAELIAMSDEQAAHVINAWPTLRRNFIASESQPGQMYNVRLERVRKELRRFRRVSKKGGESRARQATRGANGVFQPTASLTPAVAPADSQPTGQAEASTATAIATATATAPLRASAEVGDSSLAMRAGRLTERYRELYREHRGAYLLLMGNSLEFQAALKICEAWPDDRIDKLAILVLTTDDEWISGTDRNFTIFCKKASWADNLLAAWEKKQGVSA